MVGTEPQLLEKSPLCKKYFFGIDSLQGQFLLNQALFDAESLKHVQGFSIGLDSVSVGVVAKRCPLLFEQLRPKHQKRWWTAVEVVQGDLLGFLNRIQQARGDSGVLLEDAFSHHSHMMRREDVGFFEIPNGFRFWIRKKRARFYQRVCG